MSQCYLDAVRQSDQTANPLFVFLRVRLTAAERGRASLVMPLGRNLLQGGGRVAGGMLATMADECMAHAVLSVLDPSQTIVTTEMNIRYLRQADPDQGGELVAHASVVKSGRRTAVAEASVHDANGRLLATAGASFYVLSAAPAD